MIRSPEILTEPVVHDDLLEELSAYHQQFGRSSTQNTIGPVIPDGVLGAAIDFIAYWQAVGPRLGQQGKHRAEVEATFDLAFKRLRLDGWRCTAHSDGSVAVYVPGRDRPMFTCRWVSVDDPNSGWASRAHDNPSWYSEDGWWGGSDTRMHSPTIDAMLGVYVQRVKNQAAVS